MEGGCSLHPQVPGEVRTRPVLLSLVPAGGGGGLRAGTAPHGLKSLTCPLLADCHESRLWPCLLAATQLEVPPLPLGL